MTHGSALTQKARYRSHCTGTSHQASLQRLAPVVDQHPVPNAGRDQCLLEAGVFERLGGTVDYCAHPAGVAFTLPAADHLAIRLDPKLGPRHRLPEHTVGALLPTWYTDGKESESPGGMIGARLHRIDADGLHLGLAGTDARVTLTGPTQDHWLSILADHRAWCTEHELTPLWDAPELTSHERDYLDQDATWWQERADAAWVGSGLLRRIALLHTVTKPYCVKYWQHGLGWKFELNYEHGVTVNHDTLIDHLTHPRWGMPLQVKHDYCACKPCDCDGGAERSCWFRLVPQGDQGGVSIHFRRTRTGYRNSDVYERLVAAGAEPVWLEQALPTQHGSAAARRDARVFVPGAELRGLARVTADPSA
ncbi:hypothetical protein [Streptomyces sp. NPDC090994]|uniref:hypothetical protein n=1 Tax=Streptomyces sp. NPDC090994 TaxID=3365969 RepID=UPI00381F6445